MKFAYYANVHFCGLSGTYAYEVKMNVEEIVMIAITAAATFALLDMYAPSVGLATRQGAGFGIGAGLVQFPAGMGGNAAY